MEKDEKKTRKPKSKEKIEEESLELLNKVLSGNLIKQRDKVGFILNHFISARNSDLELAWLYWQYFENDKFNGSHITKEDMKSLTKITSLTRSRAQIQNEYKLFQADEKVRKYRGVLREEIREKVIEEKPEGLPTFSLYIDETGKTQDYLSVGSLWVVEGHKVVQSYSEIREWFEKEKIDYEFHFAEVKAQKLDAYKEFFLKYLKLNPTIGFKAIIVNKKGIKDVNSAITDLTFHLIHKGVLHESSSGRASLPRHLQAWIDEEEKGADQLKVENLKERLSSQSIQGLYLGEFRPVSSKDNFSIQIVDLFTASINRRIHNPNSQGKVKDELADYILGLLNFDISSINLNNEATDKSQVFNLAFNNEKSSV